MPLLLIFLVYARHCVKCKNEENMVPVPGGAFKGAPQADELCLHRLCYKAVIGASGGMKRVMEGEIS